MFLSDNAISRRRIFALSIPEHCSLSPQHRHLPSLSNLEHRLSSIIATCLLKSSPNVLATVGARRCIAGKHRKPLQVNIPTSE